MSLKKPFERLPGNVTPVHYDLSLKPDLAKFTFEGSLKINIKVNEATPKITLNVNEIVIVDDGLNVQCAEQTIALDRIEYSKEDETATLHFKEKLVTGDALLSLKFTGIINNSLRGFYRSKSVDANGKTRYSAVTQFAPTDARRAFPCWDEPALKASFDITLIVPSDGKTKALSNMDVISETIDQTNYRIVKFAPTPIMSTYLVAFVVGEFDHIETKSADGVKVGVYAPVGKAEQGRFALEMAAKALDYYRQYFGIAYPLNKMDLIAFPDLAYGAMENWGLVSYRETRLLVDANNTSTVTRQNVALVVAHELAHQWFGNLVTMEWWTHLWLNEGFASFIEYLCVDNLFPNYNIWTQFVCDDFLRAMELDGLDNSHPIEVPVGHPSEIDEIFDAISYCKGASVIRMLYNYIGDEAFRKGMNLYLTRHSYKNAQTEDLWDALEEASQKPVRRVMSTWTRQKGFPVITVNFTSEPGSTKNVVQLHQEKFNLNGQLTDDDKQSLWSVPLAIVSQSSNNKSILDNLFETRESKFSLEIGPEDWFKLNPSAVGTYRVGYSSEMLNKFLPGITKQTIAPLDRLNLLDDLYALVLCGKQRAVDLLKFISAFKLEHDYTVWVALNSILSKFSQLFAGSKISAKFREFGCNLLNESVFPYLGWTPKPDEPYLDSLLRSLVINRLVTLEDPNIIAQCQTLFQQQLTDNKPIPADFRSAVYRGVASQADEKTFDQLLKIYRESDLQEEKNRALTSLGSVKDEKLIQKALKLTLNDEVRLQDSVQLLNFISANPLARDAAWSFFQSNKEQFSTRMQAGILVAQLAKHVTHYFTTEQRANEVESFFRENSFPGTERAVQQAVETIRLNANILARNADEVSEYLESL